MGTAWSPTPIFQICNLILTFPPNVHHLSMHSLSSWHSIAQHAIPVPDDWIPELQLSHVNFESFKPIVPGKSYDYWENKDPYPEFCWTSQRLRKCVHAEAAGRDAETADEGHWPEIIEKNNTQPEITQCSKFLKRFINKIKVISRRMTHTRPVLQKTISSSNRASTSCMSSCSSYHD